MTAQRHPVWSVYDEYRTMQMNIYYYQEILQGELKKVRIADGIITVLAPSSALVAFINTQMPIAKLATLVPIATGIAAVYKKICNLDKDVENTVKSIDFYRKEFNKLHSIVVKIETIQSYTSKIQQEFLDLVEKRTGSHDTDPRQNPNMKILRWAQQKVNSENPRERFFIPQTK